MDLSTIKPSAEQTHLSKTFQPGVWHLVATLIVLFLWMRLVFWGGWGIGLSLALLFSEGLLFFWRTAVSDTKYLPQESMMEASQSMVSDTNIVVASPSARNLKTSVSDTKDLVVLTVIIVLIAFSFSLFENPFLRVLNILILMVLLPAQFLLMFPIKSTFWHRPLFWVELALSVLIRPLIALGDLGGLLRQIRRSPQLTKAEGSRPMIQRTLPQVILGVLIAIPVLFVLSLLLASADAIFAERLSGIHEWANRISAGDLVGQLALTFILLPFALSWLLSGWQGKMILSDSQITRDLDKCRPSSISTQQGGRILIITILASINLLYLFFALIQIRYLTGAWQAQLPNGMTYSQYARSGFFELMGVSAINVLILLFVTRRYGRSGTSGAALRVMIHILLAGSLVQWASAIFRMRMYIDTYALTHLRFYSSAFMLLILVWMLLLLAAEWLPRLVVGRWLITSALIAFILLNYSCPDALIARFNVQTALAADPNASQTLDLDYLTDLSDDAMPALLPLLQVDNETLRTRVESIFHERLEIIEDAQSNGPWQNWTVNRSRAYHAINKALD